MRVKKTVKIIGNGIVVEFSEKSIYFPENFLSGVKMNSEKYHDWPSISQELFGWMSEHDIKNVARQINEQICRIESLCQGIVYDYVNILPRKGNGMIAKEFVKISDAHIVKKNGREHLLGFVDGKKYSVAAKTQIIAVGNPL